MKPTSWYLAGRYCRRAELAEYAEQMKAAGHLITSRWLSGDHDDMDDAECSRIDMDDVYNAQNLLAFTENPRSVVSRGGRHVELGIAIGAMFYGHPWGMPTKLGSQRFYNGDRGIYVVGPIENIFYASTVAITGVYRSFEDFYTQALL